MKVLWSEKPSREEASVIVGRLRPWSEENTVDTFGIVSSIAAWWSNAYNCLKQG